MAAFNLSHPRAIRLLYKRKWVALLLRVFLFATSVQYAHAERKALPVTVVLGSFEEEANIIKRKLSNKEARREMGIQLVIGEIGTRKVVVALTGAGKVNAAMTTALLLQNFNPSEVIFTGIAGSLNPKLRPGDIVIAEKLAQHDLGSITSQGFEKASVVNPTNGTRNPIFIPVDNALLSLAQQATQHAEFTEIADDGKNHKPKVVRGTIITGDIFVASKKKKSSLAREFEADAVEMEGAAVAQVCYQLGVPFVVLRSLSDNADQNARHDMQQFYKTAAMNSAALTLSLLTELAARDSEARR